MSLGSRRKRWEKGRDEQMVESIGTQRTLRKAKMMCLQVPFLAESGQEQVGVRPMVCFRCGRGYILQRTDQRGRGRGRGAKTKRALAWLR